MKGPLRSLEITYLVHATEDQEKLGRALGRYLPSGTPIQEELLEGHYGNPIRRVRVHVTGEEARMAFGRIVSAIGGNDRKEIMGSLLSRLDEHSALFLRFDKQSMAAGSLRLGSTDPVRVRVKPVPFLLGRDPEAFYSKLLAVTGP